MLYKYVNFNIWTKFACLMIILNEEEKKTTKKRIRSVHLKLNSPTVMIVNFKMQIRRVEIQRLARNVGCFSTENSTCPTGGLYTGGAENVRAIKVLIRPWARHLTRISAVPVAHYAAAHVRNHGDIMLWVAITIRDSRAHVSILQNNHLHMYVV